MFNDVFMILNYIIYNGNKNQSLYQVSMKRNKDNKNEICFFSGKTFIFSVDKRYRPDVRMVERYLMSILLSKVNKDGIDMKRIFTSDLSDILPIKIKKNIANFCVKTI